MTDLSNLKLFATQPHPCSYLEGEEATTLFIDPNAPVDQDLYSQLSQIGFRRSGAHLYRPHCAQCSACVSCRIPVEHFRPNRKQRRCWRRNEDLTLAMVERIDADEHYELYAHYINTRHRDGDMYPPSRAQYEAFLSRAWGVTQYLEVRNAEDRLLAVAVCDRLDDGLSAVYTFFDSREDRRSLGVFGILAQVEQAKALGLRYVYLGYWIKQCRKMDYKTQYRPLEMLVNRRWVRVN
ncbi:arginyltransferase [Marinimicrobium koreense]|jgi:arginine-tRNA-protein transferase|uniref:Aspartate/glutamate leucyltransferase n=1 Tax=Marinimicrobium koreense TaxID=306545 RepID=A0A3N1NW97_9GAMM|nr:arginyltransferase [Marinimicrobium koreense]ROQ20455.1 arginine-tRNA-protein transferase [Marinimicrobium koreense]